MHKTQLGFNIINGVVSKNSAALIANEDYIILFSYDTTVLEYDRRNRKVLSIYPCSVTTTKAINQVIRYFNLDIDAHKEYKKLQKGA